jgi:hypothetical protein
MPWSPEKKREERARARAKSEVDAPSPAPQPIKVDRPPIPKRDGEGNPTFPEFDPFPVHLRWARDLGCGWIVEGFL